MNVIVILKDQKETRALQGNFISLDSPSLVKLPVRGNDVARVQRDENDLELLLKNGKVLKIENFFVETPAGRHDIEFTELE